MNWQGRVGIMFWSQAMVQSAEKSALQQNSCFCLLQHTILNIETILYLLRFIARLNDDDWSRIERDNWKRRSHAKLILSLANALPWRSLNTAHDPFWKLPTWIMHWLADFENWAMWHGVTYSDICVTADFSGCRICRLHWKGYMQHAEAACSGVSIMVHFCQDISILHQILPYIRRIPWPLHMSIIADQPAKLGRLVHRCICWMTLGRTSIDAFTRNAKDWVKCNERLRDAMTQITTVVGIFHPSFWVCGGNWHIGLHSKDWFLPCAGRF